MLRICVADDSKADVDRLKQHLDRLFSGIEYTLTVFKDGADLAYDYSPAYDIILLDIEMPRMNGMDTARAIRRVDSDVVIIFLTRMAQYAVKGYEVNALDFIVKPVDYPSFALKMKRAINVVSRKQEHKIAIRSDSGLLWIPVSSVYYIEVIKHDLTYHTMLGTYTARGGLSELEAAIGRYGFRYSSRYCLVNLRYVQGIFDWYVLVAGEKLALSRRKRGDLMDAYMSYYGGTHHD